MGQKVNFNKKKKNSKIKYVGIGLVVVFSGVVLYRSVNNILNSPEIVQNNSNLGIISTVKSNYDSLEELFLYYDCKLINFDNSNDLKVAKVDFKYDLYTGETSNERFFVNICKDVALFVNYKNFELLDDNKNIKIECVCEGTNIVGLKINGDVNYYLNKNSEINKTKTVNTTNFSIQSKQLKQLIDNDWDENKVDWGTKESNFNNYNIFFDEGIRYKTVGKKVFNVIWTEKYNGKIAGGLDVSATPEQVKAMLGEPTFKNYDEVYGYVSSDNYLFFDFYNHQVSVYPVVKITKEEENILNKYIEELNETLDVKQFALNLTNLWDDYDEYEFDSNYVDLEYTLKGLKFCINTYYPTNGLLVYQNYNGNRNITELENVYMKDTDAIFDFEKSRSSGESEKYYSASLQENTDSENYYVELIKDENYDIIKVRFIAKNSDFPDVELNENINSYVWMSETEVLYSIKNKGIYYYNFNTLTKQKIIEGQEEFNIKSYENNILYYDETATKIEK